jgi:hypothetical protein
MGLTIASLFKRKHKKLSLVSPGYNDIIKEVEKTTLSVSFSLPFLFRWIPFRKYLRISLFYLELLVSLNKPNL